MTEMLEDFKDTWIKVMKSPGDFFAHMPKEGGYRDPVQFAVINYLIAGMTSIILMVIRFSPSFSEGYFDIISLALELGMYIGIFILSFIFLFIGGGIFYFFFRILGGTGTYEGTVRLVAYASAAMALSGIPFVAILAVLYLIIMTVIGGTNVHKVSPAVSAIAVVVPAILVTILLIVIVAVIALFVFSAGGILHDDSSSVSRYNYRIALDTNSELENLTFYVPLPVFMNESDIGNEAIIQYTGIPENWDISMIETEHGIMLKLTAIELKPELQQLIEVEPSAPGQPNDLPTGEVHSFLRGSIEVDVSMEADHVIDTRNAVINEPHLSPKINMNPVDDTSPYSPHEMPPRTWNYDSFIYADYRTSPDANVEICVSVEGFNERWNGGWTYNGYRDHLCSTFTGEQHGWISVKGELVQGEGRYT